MKSLDLEDQFILNTEVIIAMVLLIYIEQFLKELKPYTTRWHYVVIKEPWEGTEY